MIRKPVLLSESPRLWMTKKVGLTVIVFLFAWSPAIVQATEVRGGLEAPPQVIQELDLKYVGELAQTNGYEIKLPSWLPDDHELVGMWVGDPGYIVFFYFPGEGLAMDRILASIPLYQGNNLNGYQRPYGVAPIIYFTSIEKFIQAGGILFGVEEASHLKVRTNRTEINLSPSFFGASTLAWTAGNTRFSISGRYSLDELRSVEESLKSLDFFLTLPSGEVGERIMRVDNAGAAYLFDANTGSLLQTFLNPTPDIDDLFGASVSIDGSNVLIGAYLDNTAKYNAGAAYLFDANTGNLLRTFLNPTPAADDWFGRPISIDGRHVLIGAQGDDTADTNAGAAYLFDANTGNLLRTFLNPTPAADDQFGLSVSIDGSNVLIGAHLDDTADTNAGAAYLFDANTGSLLQTFLNPTPAISNIFGGSVSIDGSNVLISAALDLDKNGFFNDGVTYLFDANTGSLLQTFLNPTQGIDDRFGGPLSIDGSNVLIGAIFSDAYLDNPEAYNAGAAYLFDANTGSLLQTFLNPTPAADDQFGASLSIDGSNVLISAYLDDTAKYNAGAAYLFDANTGSLLQIFVNPTPDINDQFGRSVSIDGSNVLIGAYLDNLRADDVEVAEVGEHVMRAISVNPNRGDAGETIELEIFGQNFEDGARIRFTPSSNGIFVQSVKFVNSTLLKATIDINGGAQTLRVELTVINPNGYNSSTITDAFDVHEVRRNTIREDNRPSASLRPSGPSVLLLQEALIIMIGVIGIIVAVWWFRRQR